MKMANGDETVNLGLRSLTDEGEDDGWLKLVACASFTEDKGGDIMIKGPRNEEITCYPLPYAL